MADPEYTEFGIKIHKLRFTLKVQRRPTPTPSTTSEDDRSVRSRTYSTASSIADSLGLGLLNLEPPRSRRPIATESAWEFYPMRTSTPSSGYNSTASVSRASSFSSKLRITSTDDSAYSEVYSTIEELCELQDPFEDEEQPPKHVKTASSSSTVVMESSTLLRSAHSCNTLLPPKPAPPLPPRMSSCRPPARPPYPSSHAKQRSM